MNDEYIATMAVSGMSIRDGGGAMMAEAGVGHRARLKGGPQVARMLQEKPSRSGKQEQQQNSPNLGTAL